MSVSRTRILGVGRAVPELGRHQRRPSRIVWTVRRVDPAAYGHPAAAAHRENTGATGSRQARRRGGLALSAGVSARDVDLLIFATLSPDIDWPSCACLLTHKLGMRNVPAFDVKNQCSGFIYSLASADAMIRAGRARGARWSSAARSIRRGST